MCWSGMALAGLVLAARVWAAWPDQAGGSGPAADPRPVLASVDPDPFVDGPPPVPSELDDELDLRAGDAGATRREAAARRRAHAGAAARRRLSWRAASVAIARPVMPATAKLSCVPPIAQSQPAKRPPSGARPAKAQR
jgi:hypothetical protein